VRNLEQILADMAISPGNEVELTFNESRKLQLRAPNHWWSIHPGEHHPRFMGRRVILMRTLTKQNPPRVSEDSIHIDKRWYEEWRKQHAPPQEDLDYLNTIILGQTICPPYFTIKNESRARTIFGIGD
jgi:hypothetical protein